jgi:hypothetical protein
MCANHYRNAVPKKVRIQMGVKDKTRRIDMSKNNYQSIDNNCLCDGYGCYFKDISELQVKVKETRTFFLFIYRF